MTNQANETQSEEINPTPYKGVAQRDIKENPDVNDVPAAKAREEALAAEVEEEPQEDVREPLIGKKPRTNWKKRYDDSGRELKRLKDEWAKEKKELEAKVNESSMAASLPSTPEEMDEFQKEYPDLYNRVTNIARKEADHRVTDVEARIQALKDQEAELEKSNAEQALLKAHPDFVQLREDEKFLDWLDEQPASISNGIYENDTDHKWASRVLDLYKADVGQKKRSKKSQEDAAAAVTVTSKTDVDTGDGSNAKIWTQREISQLKPHEFEKLEKELDRAAKDGRVI